MNQNVFEIIKGTGDLKKKVEAIKSVNFKERSWKIVDWEYWKENEENNHTDAVAKKVKKSSDNENASLSHVGPFQSQNKKKEPSDFQVIWIV